jgi:hypothetical protein
MRADTVARIRSKLGKKLMPESAPWHDIICDEACGERNLDAIAGWANALAEPSDAVFSRVQQLPRYVAPHALETKRYSSMGAGPTGLYHPGVDAPPVRGIVTINVRSVLGR